MPSLEPEPGVQLVRQGLVLEHARLPGVANGSLIQVQRCEGPAGDALDLRREQQPLAAEVLSAVLRQNRKRCPSLFHLLEVGRSLVGGGAGVVRGQRETIPEIEQDRPDRTKEMVK